MEIYREKYQFAEVFYPIVEDLCSENAILSDNSVYNALKKIQDQYIINDYSIISENEKGKFVIRQLLKAYLSNPLQLPDSVLHYYSLKCENPSICEDLNLQNVLQKNIRYINNSGSEELRLKIVYDSLFLRVICDYISSMTDLFAVSEYQRLYGMKIS